MIYSAGYEGVIRVWKLNERKGLYEPSNGENNCVGVWACHQDTIWQLVHSPNDDILLSVCADGTVKAWKAFDPIQA